MGERRTVIIVGTTIVLFVGLIVGWVFTGSSAASANIAQVTDKTDIGHYVQLSHVGILTSENYFGQKVRLIGGILKNVSDKPVRTVDLKMVFSDYDGKSILESVQPGYSMTLKPLKPGDQYRFQVGFENLPRNWNYHEPTVEIVKVGY